MVDFTGDRNPRYKHGLTDGRSYRHPVYTCWQNMKARCLNPNNHHYHRYGGRGITICDEWMDSATFADWAFSNGWAKGLTLDRIDNDGNYRPDNCEWVSRNANSRKKSTTKLDFAKAELIRQRVANGESEYKLADEYGVVHGTIWFIVHGDRHWLHIEDARP